jgi:ribonuclease HII
VIKGDSIYASNRRCEYSAKTYRDEYMLNLHQQFPFYGWHTNKGYGTLEHRRAIHRIMDNVYITAERSVSTIGGYFRNGLNAMAELRWRMADSLVQLSSTFISCYLFRIQH